MVIRVNVIYKLNCIAILFCQYHITVVFATGTSEENSLGVPGEDLEGVWPAASFVSMLGIKPS